MNDLLATCREKYALGLERLQAGDASLALLSLHGALEDGLRAYLTARGMDATGDWPALLAALRADGRRPLSDADAERLRRTNSLRNRLAHGEQIALAQSAVGSYAQFVAQLLRTYGVAVRQPHTSTGTQRARGSRRLATPGGARTVAWASALRGQLKALAGRGFLVPVATALLVLAVGWLATRALQPSANRQPAIVAAPQPTAIQARPQITTLVPVQGSAAGATQAVAPAYPPPEGIGVQAAPGALAVGGRAVVLPEGDLLNLRTLPGQGADSVVLASLAAGTDVAVLEGPVEADGRAWWRVRAGEQEGWCAGEFLSAQAGP
jgi:hypothetical protein